MSMIPIAPWPNGDPLGDAASYQGKVPKTGRNLINGLGGVNLYAMVDNNPIRSIDTDGRGKVNVPEGERDQNWVLDCMGACNEIICKHAPYPNECVKACYGQCDERKIPNVSCALKGPKSLKDIVLGGLIKWLMDWL